MSIRGVHIGLAMIAMLAGAQAIAAGTVAHGSAQAMTAAAKSRAYDSEAQVAATHLTTAGKSAASAVSSAAGWAMMMFLGSAVIGVARRVDISTLDRITV